jgi:Na+-driven multidrug efflux pump
MSLMTGFYFFADQLMLSIFVPIDGVHNWQNLFGQYLHHTSEEIQSMIEQSGLAIPFLLPGDIVKSAINISSPSLSMINAAPLISAIGSGVLYTQCIGKNNQKMAREIYKTSFLLACFVGGLTSVLGFFMNNSILELMIGNHINFDQISDPILKQYAQLCRVYQLE